MRTCTRRAAEALLFTLALAVLSAGWLGGGRAYAYGTKAKGLAGAGVALPQDAEAARLNPAGMVYVGTRADAGLAAMTSDRSYAVTGTPSGEPGTSPLPPGVHESDGGTVWVPIAAANWMLGERSSIGVLTYGHGILHTDYPGGTSVSTEQLWVLPTYARKVGNSFAAGASAVMVYHRFRAKGMAAMAPFVSDGNPDNLSDNGYDTVLGLGGKVGVQARVRPSLTLGASYQSKIRMGRLKKYADLFPDQGRFDQPAVLMLGLAWRPAPQSTIVFDVERTFNSDVPALANPLSQFLQGVTTGDTSALLGGSNGAGFGWRNVTTYKLGYQWQPSAAWVWRTGASYGRQPIPSSDVLLNTNGVNVQEWRLTAGLTHSLSERREVSASLMFAPRARERGPNPMEVPGQQSIELRSQEWEIETSYAWKF